MKKIACLFWALLVVILPFEARASCPVAEAGQYIMTYNSGTKYMSACKFGDSLRNLCGNVGVSCTAGQEGDVEYSAAGTVLRYCNGSNWINVQCEALGSCVGTAAGTISADTTQMKYCNGTTWQAMYNDGICVGIGVQEAVFTPTGASHGQNTMYYGWEDQIAMTDDYAAVGSQFATRVRLRDGAVTMYKRTGAAWARIKELVPSVYGVTHYFGNSVSMDGDYIMVGAYSANRAFIFKKDQGGADNWGEIAVRSGSQYHGFSVDIEGDKAIAGSPYHGTASSGSGYRQGRARIYRKDRSGVDAWGEVVILENPEVAPVASDRFGDTVAIAGDIAVVASPYQNEGGIGDAGAVWLYRETALDTWSLLKKITNPNGLGSSDLFGYAVDIKDNDGNGTADRLVVSALSDDDFGSNKGTIFVFERDQGGANNWGLVTHTGDRTNANPTTVEIGRGLSLTTNNKMIVGVRANDDQGVDAGAAIIFGKDTGGANNWGIEEYIYAGDPAVRNEFGRAVAFSETGAYAMASAPFDITNDPVAGAAYIFSRSGTTSTQRAKLAPTSSIEYSVRMGDSVAVSGDYAAVGIIYKTDLWNTLRTRATGGVNIYKRAANATWSLEKHITPETPYGDGHFGITVDISPEFLAVAVPGDNAGASDSGAIMLYSRNHGGVGNWGEFKKLKALDRQASDVMGSENGLSLFGDYIVAGALGDDGTLVSPQGNSGSAYIFNRNQGGADNWGQVKKLIPPVDEHEARFGNAVDMGGNIIAVASRIEDANGVNSGAVYLFSKDQGGTNNWGQIKKFVGEAANDHFGYDVAVSGDTVAVGAPYQDAAGTDRGAVYLYYKDQGGAGNWGLFKKLNYPGVSSGNALFGFQIDLAGDILIVGAPYDDTNLTDAGYVYVFSRNEGGNDNWGQLATIVPNTPGETDYFGYSVSVSGNVVAGGGLYNDDGGKDDGSVYLFGCPPTP